MEENDGESSHADDVEDIANLFDVVISDPSPADKRAHHNALERKRRDLIKASFESLQICVPNITDSKASRAQILKKATNYISLMKEKIDKFQKDIIAMRANQKKLDQQVIALEKIKATSTFARSQGFIGKPEDANLSDPAAVLTAAPSIDPPVATPADETDLEAADGSPPKKRLRSSN